MTPPSAGVERARRALGARLRELRTDAGLSGRDLGRLAGWHSSKISKIEYGRQVPSEADLRAWCLHCGVQDQAADLVESLRAIDEMYTEWRRVQRTGMRRHQQSAVPLYESTARFRIYEPSLIPGLFQTREYAHALMSAVIAFRGIPDDADEAVAARMDRQKVVRAGVHRFAVVLEEAALRTRIGGADVMAGQLGRLLTLASQPNVSLGIIPASVDRVIWPMSGFWVFDEGRVLVETPSAELAITQPREIGIYTKAFAELSASAVHGPQARSLITGALEALDALQD
ncbi:helix-turn-helix transcriptional regulator [Actinocorallia sp. A-T 12471]|uniref:helix-turn-helix domain-containing protein n=1 Tax=Actinocorallia sp. A-T 12471 TaxID=3089813 RepID=UPI0029D3EDD0|nr:helix-turn-helix transcriptional regulator [Actinocorallia sp. A-T 12471]MDX6739614.1 helix-turn-helix transcriptional regulator [Actinocorallia sp. A-T 12471]